MIFCCHLSPGPGDGLFSLVPFVDFGWVDNLKGDPDRPDEIASAGLGAIWDIGKNLRAELYWGKALREIDTPGDHDIQDDGIHFRIRSRLF